MKSFQAIQEERGEKAFKQAIAMGLKYGGFGYWKDPQTGETASLFIKSDMTVTFHKMKQGIPKRKDLTGELFAEKIGIPPEAEIDVL